MYPFKAKVYTVWITWTLRVSFTATELETLCATQALGL